MKNLIFLLAPFFILSTLPGCKPQGVLYFPQQPVKYSVSAEPADAGGQGDFIFMEGMGKGNTLQINCDTLQIGPCATFVTSALPRKPPPCDPKICMRILILRLKGDDIFELFNNEDATIVPLQTKILNANFMKTINAAKNKALTLQIK